MNTVEGDDDKVRLAERLKTAPLSPGCDYVAPESHYSLRREGGLRLSQPQRANLEAGRVSVVTVCRNSEATIANAIESVLKQTYDGVEHIVVDGASTDKTVDVIESYRDRIEYFVSEPDGGIYAAMNKAIRLASGEFIVILNADDLLEPSFVEMSLEVLRRTGADITFCDYRTEAGSVICPKPNDGILFTQLGIKHNTFLCHRTCFETVGGFDVKRKINSDARWIRAAYLSGMKFEKVEAELVFYSTFGASMGGSEQARRKIIEESASLIRLCFPFLASDEADRVYTSNFNTHSADLVIKLREAYSLDCPIFASAIDSFIRYNLRERDGYICKAKDSHQYQRVFRLCDALNIPLSHVRWGEADSDVEAFLASLERISELAATKPDGVVLHCARKFSSPSETFIHELVSDLQQRELSRLHVVLCDERLLESERPFDNVLVLDWGQTRSELRTALYERMWQKLSPGLLISHFALNGFWFFQRFTPEQRATPTINMCHGIDVFAVSGGNSDYAEYIHNFCVAAPNVAFTVVSDYLKKELVRQGVPEEKVHLVPNCVSKTFYEHRKKQGFFDGRRPLRILNIGRLIDWKGHDHLLRALGQVDIPAGFKLSIVYGGMDERLSELDQLTMDLGLQDRVEFIPFVDLAANPTFFAGFDLFVLPSTTDSSDPPRTETFGIAILEAIASGLAVIGTSAGGIPEVVGKSTVHGRIVQHGNSTELARAIQECADHWSEVFTDNSIYAIDRLEAFSSEKRYKLLRAAEGALRIKRPKVYHFSALAKGGAAGATLNIHMQLLRHGWDSWFVTRAEERDRFSKFIPNTIFLEPEYSVDFRHVEVGRRTGFSLFSVDDHAISNDALCSLVADADVINFAWYAQMVSVENIAAVSRLGIPITITLRDMNPISGGCHYFHGCVKWQTGCGECPQLLDGDAGYTRAVVAAKKALWNRDSITFVALSDHSRAILDRSTVAQGFKKVTLHNMVDDRRFYALSEKDRRDAREKFGFPKDRVVVGYLPSFHSVVKGHEQLQQALAHLSETKPDLDIVLGVLSNSPVTPDDFPYEVIRLPQSSDFEFLREYYNAVDMVAVPSLEETFSNTTVEALACGTPVVGFKTGVLAELFSDDLRLGAAVAPGDVIGLADMIARLAARKVDRSACVEIATRKFSRIRQAEEYDNLYRELMEGGGSRKPTLSVGAVSVESQTLAELLARRKAKSMRKRLIDQRKIALKLQQEVKSLHDAREKELKANKAAISRKNRILKDREATIQELKKSQLSIYRPLQWLRRTALKVFG